MLKSLIVIVAFLGFNLGSKAQRFDYYVLEEWNMEDHNSQFDKSFQFISNSNNFFIVGAPLVLFTVGAFEHNADLNKAGINAFISLGVSTAFTWALKSSVKRQRPFIEYNSINKLSNGGGPSFPSGHTSSAFAVATSLSLSYPKWYVIIPSYLFAGSVAVSRVKLGVHFPSDILAGAAVGIGSAYLTHWANKKLHPAKRTLMQPEIF